jgi:hypothetical protein
MKMNWAKTGYIEIPSIFSAYCFMNLNMGLLLSCFEFFDIGS